MKSCVALAVILASLASSLQACDVTTAGSSYLSSTNPMAGTSSQFSTSFSASNAPLSCFYSTATDLINGFIVEFDVNIVFPAGTTVATGINNAMNYPSIKLELSSGLPGITSGSLYAVTISPAGVIVGNNGGTDHTTTAGSITGSQTIFLSYVASAGSGTLSVSFGTATAAPAYTTTITPAALQAALGSAVGYVGIVTTQDSYVTQNWSSFTVNKFAITTIPVSASNSQLSPVPASSTITAGGSVSYTLTAKDACSQQMRSPAVATAFSALLYQSGGPQTSLATTGTVTPSTDGSGNFVISFQVNVAGVMDLLISLGATPLSSFPLSRIVTSTAGPIYGPATLLTNIVINLDLNKQPFVFAIQAFDQLKNPVSTDPAPHGPAFFSGSLVNIATPTIMTPVNVTWSNSSSNYVLSFSVASAGTYELHVTYGGTDIPNSPYALTIAEQLPNNVTVQSSNLLAIILGAVAGVVLLLSIYGLWRGLRYRTKVRKGKKDEEEAIHKAKVAKHDAEQAASVLSNQLVVADEGGYVSQQQVEEAQRQADEQEAKANIEKMEVERLDIAIQLKREQIAKIKREKQLEEARSKKLGVEDKLKGHKKKNEFGQVSNP